jgi:hypothetical protein
MKGRKPHTTLMSLGGKGQGAITTAIAPKSSVTIKIS